MSPARSASNSPCPQAPPVMWSQRALPNTDIIIKGEGLPLDSSRTSSTISVNGRLGGGAMGPVGAGGNPTRSFLQTKVGAKMLKQGRDQSQVLSQEVSGEPPRDKQNSSLKEEGGAEKQQEEEPLPIGGPGDSSSCNPQQRDSRSDSGFLDTFVEKKDQELFQRCREHLDSINQSTQQQQFINDEMRSQAEVRRYLVVVLFLCLLFLFLPVNVVFCCCCCCYYFYCLLLFFSPLTFGATPAECHGLPALSHV